MLQRGRTFVDVNEVVDASSFFPSFDMIPIYKSTPASQPLDSDLNDRYKAEYERMDQTFTSTAPSQHVKVPNVLGGRYKAEYERMGQTFTSTAHSQHVKVPNVLGGFNCRRFAKLFVLYKAHYERTAHKFNKCDHHSLDAMGYHVAAVLRGEPRTCGGASITQRLSSCMLTQESGARLTSTLAGVKRNHETMLSESSEFDRMLPR